MKFVTVCCRNIRSTLVMLSLLFVALTISTCVAEEVVSGRRGVRSFASKATNEVFHAPSSAVSQRRELSAANISLLANFICSEVDVEAPDADTKECVCEHMAGITAIITPCSTAIGGFAASATGIGFIVGAIALVECIDAVEEYTQNQDELEAICNAPVTITITPHGYGYNNALRMRSYQTNAVPESWEGSQDNLHRLHAAGNILEKPATADNLFTSGPGARGIDFHNDADFVAGNSIGKRCRDWTTTYTYRKCSRCFRCRGWSCGWRDCNCKNRTGTNKHQECDNDYYMVAFTGVFTAQEDGAHEFGIEKVDDIGTIWLDLDQDGSFQESERLVNGTAAASVELVAGQSYKFAATYGEYHSGASLKLTIMSPAQTEGHQTINPSQYQQRGMWNSGDDMFSPPEGSHIEVISSYQENNNYCVDGFGADVDTHEVSSQNSAEECTAQCTVWNEKENNADCSAAEYFTRGNNQSKCLLVIEARHAMRGKIDKPVQDREMKCYVRREEMAVRACPHGEQCCRTNLECANEHACYQSATGFDLPVGAICGFTDVDGCYCQKPTGFPPSEQPTEQPTAFPSEQPTEQPSHQPTYPTMSPTQTPTHGDGHVIYTHTGAAWGNWASSFHECDSGSWAQCIRVRIEGDRGFWGDDTALNSIALTCKTPEGDTANEITSNEGHRGSWGSTQCCHGNDNFIVGYRWRGEGSGGDDTAGNGIRAKCSGGEELAPGDGHEGGWSGWTYCPEGQSVFEMMTQVEGNGGWFHDNTAMGAVKFGCGATPTPAPTFCVTNADCSNGFVCYEHFKDAIFDNTDACNNYDDAGCYCVPRTCKPGEQCCTTNNDCADAGHVCYDSNTDDYFEGGDRCAETSGEGCYCALKPTTNGRRLANAESQFDGALQAPLRKED